MEDLPRLQSRADDGVTLIEVLITIVISGILFAGLLGGLAGMIKSSALHRRQADVGAVVRSGAETLKTAAYSSCLVAGFPNTYNSALSSVAHPPNVNAPTVVAVTGLDGATSLVGCPSDPNLQMVKLQATSTDGNTTEVLWVVKANR